MTSRPIAKSRKTRTAIRGFTLVELIIALAGLGLVLGSLNFFTLFLRRQIVTRSVYLYPRVELASVYADLRADILRSKQSFGFAGRVFQNGSLWQAGQAQLTTPVTPSSTAANFLTAASLTNVARSNTYTLCLLDGTGKASVWVLTRDVEPSGLRYRVAWWRYQGLGQGSVEFQSSGYTSAAPDQAIPTVTDQGSSWSVTLPNPAFAYAEYLQGGAPTQATLVVPKNR